MQEDLLENPMDATLTSDAIADDSASSGTFVTFDLSGQTFGVDVRHVREILDQVNLSQLPNTPHEVEGVIDIRGETVPVLNLGSKLGLHRCEDCDDTRVIVFEIVRDGRICPVGVLADNVRDVTRIFAEEIEQTPEIVGAVWERSLMHGIARRAGFLIVLLNIERVIVGADVRFEF